MYVAWEEGMPQRGPSRINVIDDKCAWFWSKVNKTDTCWLWIADINRNGYGTVSFNGKTSRAHRVAFLIANGEHSLDNPLLKVLHKCDVRACIRFDHLYAGLTIDNAKDTRTRNRYNPLRGEQHHKAIATSTDVTEIRRLYKEEMLSYQDIVIKTGFNYRYVYAIVNYETRIYG